jgi:hypothetical protein
MDLVFDIATLAGRFLSLNAAIVLWLITTAAMILARVRWQCAFCGKVNTTNVFRAMFRICDHEGLF